MNTSFFFGIAVGLVAAVVLVAQAGSATHTVEACAGHLPKGHRYVLDLGGVIDTRGDAPSFRADIQVKSSDEAGADQASIGQFVDCVSSLLR